MLVLLIPLIFGIMAGNIINVTVNMLLIALICVAGLAFIFSKLGLSSFAKIFFVLSLVLLGVLRIELSEQGPFQPYHYRHQPQLLGQSITVSGTVLADPLEQNERYVTVFQLDSIFYKKQRYPLTGKVRVTLSKNHPPPIAGQYLKINGKMTTPSGARNPGGFDYAGYLATKKVYGILRVGKRDSIAIIGLKTIPWPQLRIISPIQRAIKRQINVLMPPIQAALIQAMLLGDRTEIPEKLTANLAKTGASHILAVSGLHTGLILFIIIMVLKLLHVPKRFRNPITIAALIFFCFLTGLNPPVIRASLMASLWLIGRQYQRFCDPLNIVATAATIILLANPVLLFTAGFQLSFGAVTGILLIRPPLVKRLKRRPKLAKLYRTPFFHGFIELAIATFSAQAAILPLLIYHFSTVPLLGVLANLLAIPLLGLILPLGVVALMVGAVTPFLAQFFVAANTVLIWILTHSVELMTRIPGSHSYCGVPALSSIIFYYAAVTAFLTLSPKIRKQMVFSFLVVANLNIWISAMTPEPFFRVIFFDVGQGDSILFLFRDKTQLLIDAGPGNDRYDSGREIIGRFLRQHGIDTIDYLLITHPHNDHIGGVPWLLKNFEVKTVIDNGIKSKSPEQEAVYQLCDSLSIPHRVWRTGDQVSIQPGCDVYVVSPPRNIPPLEMTHFLENHFSIIVQVICQRHSILLCGDAEKLAEVQLRPFGEALSSDILKIGHHGSIGATASYFLKQVAPKTAVISVGKYNRFNQPHPEVLKRLEAQQCEILRTDQNGAVVFEAFADTLYQVNWRDNCLGRLRLFQR